MVGHDKEEMSMRLDCQTIRFPFAKVLFALTLVGMVFMSSCQTTSSSQPTGPESRNWTFTDTTWVDNVSWKRGDDTGSKNFTPTSQREEKGLALNLSSPLGGGKVLVSLWTLGIRTSLVELVADGSGSLKPSSIVKDTLERALISLLYRRSTSDTSVKFSRQGLLKMYAQELVDSTNPALLGFPGRSPLGIDSAKVFDAALVYLATRKSNRYELSFSALVGKTFLGIDSGKVHDRILALINQKQIGSVDSIRLFPRPPVRVKMGVSVAPDSLVATGAKLGVKGAFEAEPNIGVAYLESKVYDSDSTDRSAWFDVIASQPTGQAEWDLSGKFSIRTDSLKPGNYRLVVTARDKDSKGSATSSTTFRVVLPPPPPPKEDATGPVVTLDGSTPSTVEGDVATATVRVKVSDESGIDKVSIGGADATLAEGVWSRSVDLPAYGRNEIVVEAADKKGNVSKLSVYITRKIPDGAKGPAVEIVGDSVVNLPFEQGTARLVWVVTDPDGLKRVEIGGASRTSTSDTFSIDVDVAPDAAPVEIRLFAINTKLIGSESVIRVVRAKDSIKPVVKVDSASWLAAGSFMGDTLIVPTAMTSFDLGLKITDNHKIASVIVAGESLKVADDGLYHWKNSSVATGVNNATFIVTDSTGLISYFYGKVLRRDQVVLSATPDADPFQDLGVVKAASTTPDAVVEYSTDGATWKLVPEGGIEIHSSVNMSFRGRKDGFNDGLLERKYVVKITPPPEAVPLIWDEGKWYDSANTAAISTWQ